MLSERSACGGRSVTVVSSSAVLFAETRSSTGELTLAELTRVVATSGEVTETVRSGAAPVGRAGRVHVIVPITNGPQDHPVPAAATSVTAGGRVSVTVTSVAGLGPAFETASV